MTAHDQMRAMLDQLMGTARNGEGEMCNVKFDDPSVCRSFLLSCCPHDILASTRMDMGECSRFHSLALRADFEAAQKRKDYFFDLEALDHLRSFVSEADRKTESAKKRLSETQEELSAEVSSKAERVLELAEKIGAGLAKAEKLGEEGEVELSMKLLGEVEELRKEKVEAETEYRNSIPAAAYQQQKLRVCEVCCAYLGIQDNDRRLADHFGGKLHLGFIKIRDTLKELEAKSADRLKEKRESRSRRSRSRSRSTRRLEEGEAEDDDDEEEMRRERRRRRESRSPPPSHHRSSHHHSSSHKKEHSHHHRKHRHSSPSMRR